MNMLRRSAPTLTFAVSDNTGNDLPDVLGWQNIAQAICNALIEKSYTIIVLIMALSAQIDIKSGRLQLIR